MSGARVQIWGRPDLAMDQGFGLFPARTGAAVPSGAESGGDSPLVPGLETAVLRLAGPFGLRDELLGQRLPDPDLHLELHTREYHARFMPPGAPRAVWFLNLPGGYFHNEALLDHYDFIFFSHELGRNYGRLHPRCAFVPPFLPQAWTGGSGEAGDPGRRYSPGVDPGRDELAGMLTERARLRGTFAGNPQAVADLPFVYGLCLKADAVLASADSPLAGACRDVGAGLHAPGDPGRVIEPCLGLEERRERVLSGCLFGNRLAEIVESCLGAWGECRVLEIRAHEF